MKKCIVHAHIIIMQGNWPISIQIKTHWSPLGWISHLRLKDISFKIIELETRYSWDYAVYNVKYSIVLCVFSQHLFMIYPCLNVGLCHKFPPNHQRQVPRAAIGIQMNIFFITIHQYTYTISLNKQSSKWTYLHVWSWNCHLNVHIMPSRWRQIFTSIQTRVQMNL